MIETPKPIEETDPEFASRLKWWCNEGHTAHPDVRIDDTPISPEPIRVEKTAGRNDPCPCGSGKKYKKCCLKNG